MLLDIPTLFIVIIVTSTALAASIAVVANRRSAPLLYWAGGLAAHALAYVFFLLRGSVSFAVSVVPANVLLSMAFALFCQGIGRFQERSLARWWVWGPVLVVAVAFPFLLDASAVRLMLGSAVLSFQSLSILTLLLQKRHSTPGRGQYILVAGFAMLVVMLLLRLLATVMGSADTLVLMSPSQLQLTTFMGSIVFMMMLATGLLLMAQERAQTRLRESQAQLDQRNHELEAANAQLQVLSLTDGLTGLANRRQFDALLASEWARATRHGHAFAAVMLDIDHFKLYNDRYGHLAGDTCLTKVAAVLQATARRAGDVVARYGGEEFAMLLVATDANAVLRLAESVREGVAALRMPNEDAPLGLVTLSVGVAWVRSTQGATPTALLQQADEMLYAAKHAGRNRVAVHRGDGAGEAAAATGAAQPPYW